MLMRQKGLLLPRNLALVAFGELLIVFSTKVNLLYLPYSTARRCSTLHLNPKMVKKVITNLDLSKASGLIVFQWWF